MNIISTSESDTCNLAIKMADKAKNGDIYLLEGPLGAGKSVFARTFIQRLVGENTDVPSPTFTLIQNYDSDKGVISHFDLYRLEDPEEIYEIGWEEALSDGILLVEWPERLGALSPASATHIQIEPLKDESRNIHIHYAKDGQ